MLPVEVITLITNHLSLEEVLSLRLVCRQLKESIPDTLWREKLLRHCPSFSPETSHRKSWEECARVHLARLNDVNWMDEDILTGVASLEVLHNVPLPDDFDNVWEERFESCGNAYLDFKKGNKLEMCFKDRWPDREDHETIIISLSKKDRRLVTSGGVELDSKHVIIDYNLIVAKSGWAIALSSSFRSLQSVQLLVKRTLQGTGPDVSYFMEDVDFETRMYPFVNATHVSAALFMKGRPRRVRGSRRNGELSFFDIQDSVIQRPGKFLVRWKTDSLMFWYDGLVVVLEPDAATMTAYYYDTEKRLSKNVEMRVTNCCRWRTSTDLRYIFILDGDYKLCSIWDLNNNTQILVPRRDLRSICMFGTVQGKLKMYTYDVEYLLGCVPHEKKELMSAIGAEITSSDALNLASTYVPERCVFSLVRSHVIQTRIKIQNVEKVVHCICDYLSLEDVNTLDVCGGWSIPESAYQRKMALHCPSFVPQTSWKACFKTHLERINSFRCPELFATRSTVEVAHNTYLPPKFESFLDGAKIGNLTYTSGNIIYTKRYEYYLGYFHIHAGLYEAGPLRRDITGITEIDSGFPKGRDILVRSETETGFACRRGREGKLAYVLLKWSDDNNAKRTYQLKLNGVKRGTRFFPFVGNGTANMALFTPHDGTATLLIAAIHPNLPQRKELEFEWEEGDEIIWYEGLLIVARQSEGKIRLQVHFYDTHLDLHESTETVLDWSRVWVSTDMTYVVWFDENDLIGGVWDLKTNTEHVIPEAERRPITMVGLYNGHLTVHTFDEHIIPDSRKVDWGEVTSFQVALFFLVALAPIFAAYMLLTRENLLFLKNWAEKMTA